MPTVNWTGERELDQIIDALNEAGFRLGEARRGADIMSTRAAHAERLAALGRVAAGVAHEIRNPIAAARLQGENALAGDDARRREAIGDMLGQIDRLDGLVGELLAMTQRVEPKPVRVDLAAFLAAQVGRHKETASARSLSVSVRGADGAASLDPVVIGRVLDNLLTNAIRHVPRGGAVVLAAAHGRARAKVLGDAPVEAAHEQADGGDWMAMAPAPGEAALWQAHCRVPGASVVRVRARDVRGREDEDVVEPAVAGWATPKRAADGSDRDRVGPWPEKGILDTQLGPNCNGKKW